MTGPLEEQDDASTPLTAEERDGLIPSYITLRGERHEGMAAGTQTLGPVPLQPLADAQGRRSRTLVQVGVYVGRRRRRVRPQDIVQEPLATQHGRSAVRVGGYRHQPPVREQASPLIGVRKHDSAHAA